MTGTVFDIKEFSVFDGPGIRTTVFMKGCPLRCQWCHNPEGLSPKPQIMVSMASCTHCGSCRKACENPDHCIACGKCIPYCRGGYRKISGTEWDSASLAERLQKDEDVYRFSGGGVTFSGGEPMMQWPFVSEIVTRLHGIHTAIETSGYTTDEIFSDAMEKLDLILIDWKVSDPEKHLYYTGVSQEPIRRHVEMLCKSDVQFILRMPIIPEVNDNEEHFRTVAELVGNAQHLIRVDILPYQKAAGAKYEMVGMEYKPDFSEDKPPEFHTEIFDQEGIPYLQFT